MVATKSNQFLIALLILTSLGILVLTMGCSSSKAPSSFDMENPYPNPFSPQTMIEYTVEDSCHVTLVLWNQQGKLIDTLVNEDQKKGYHKVDLTKSKYWNEMNGVYFYKLEACGQSATKKLVVLK
ncbi:MAG: T9SS type A sorting domain-containing protein [Candidatus Zixiibacteriota bacterium]